MRDHNRLYTLLNVLPDADPVVIEAAYKALMKRYHPDMGADGATGGRAAELNQAYRMLRDPERRASYDAEERGRQERHRAELARALQPAPGPRGAPPPPGSAPVRIGQRAAAWIACAGVLLLIAALYLLARGPEAPRSFATETAAPVPEVSSPAALRRASAAFRDHPVDRAEIEKAVAEYRRIAGSSGMSGATAYSEHCFDVHSRTLAPTDFDHCVAFDHVASRIDLRPEQSRDARQAPRFQPGAQVNRHIRAAERVAVDPSLIEARLFEIRRLTDSAASRLVPVQLSSAAPAAAAAPAALSRAPARPRAQQAPPRRPRPPPQRRRSQPEQDFLEREGGIY